MSSPKTSTEEKIVDAVMQELREIAPLANELDSLHDEEDAALRASLGDRVYELVEPYRTSERALRDIVKSLAEQNDQTPVRAEVVFGEKTAAITVSLPTLTPEREAHFGQSICSTIGGLLGLTLGKVKSFGTDAEDAARRPPAGVGWDGLPEDGPHRRGTDAVMDELRRTPFGANIPSFVQPNTDISFMYRGERNWARVYEIKRTPADGPITKIRTVGGGVYEAKDLSDVRLEANPFTESKPQALAEKVAILGTVQSISYKHGGREHTASFANRKLHPEIGEKHEFPVLEVVQYLHGHATGSGGGLAQEIAQKWAEWLEWRITDGWTDSVPSSKTYDDLVRELGKTAVAMFAKGML